ncbi:hypothetical protein TNCV_3004921 [Trichonephila clavipes]|nr:hypothetical protein TNCV_3004921 [Trichonephila clavipes]
MECRSSDIKIHPPIGKNFQEDGVLISLLGVMISHSVRTRRRTGVTDLNSVNQRSYSRILDIELGSGLVCSMISIRMRRHLEHHGQSARWSLLRLSSTIQQRGTDGTLCIRYRHKGPTHCDDIGHHWVSDDSTTLCGHLCYTVACDVVKQVPCDRICVEVTSLVR